MPAFTCGFIGLGLIGGSIAKALHARLPQTHIIAYDTNTASLELALDEGVIQEACFQIGEAFGCCDYLFLCAPVSHNDQNLFTLKKYLSPETVLTDVGSVKTGIHEHIASLGLNGQFIGGHPMTGSERFGYANSRASLFENAYYILTPAREVPTEKISAYQTLVQTIGAIPLILTCEQHDYVTAAVSHLPHVIAASLVNLVKNADSKEGVMKMIAAGGFKDITRIASSSPAMWQQICLTNTRNISSLLDRYIQDLTVFREKLDAKDADTLYQFFDCARAYRESFIGASSGPIKTEYVITVDIADKPGSIAAIASLLAEHDVSIKNIGINHNRELAEGALRIEFYEDTAADCAVRILTGHGYPIHTKKN
ncbi:MAG: prephenate dehydrogenase [Blautia sp.]|nr:prephenate dehydrogenase [Blautia sp.]MCM1200438.1 prephenate dehydrogenase [Bacteroides fragilis]